MGFQGDSAGFGDWDKALSSVKELKERKICGAGAMGRGDGRLQQVFCGRTGDETGILVWKTIRRGEGLQ